MTYWQPWSLRELVEELARGRTTAAEVLARSRARIAATDPELHAWVTEIPVREPSGSLGGVPLGGVPVGVLDGVPVGGVPVGGVPVGGVPVGGVPVGVLGGVPVGVKDIIDVAGVPTKSGTALRRDAPPAGLDAAIVTEWRRTGVVPVGKTVTTEFAFFAPGPTRNPAAPDHTPGGSSSGSAAAVASGQVPLALGTQTAGSVTRPGSFCGVASLVITHGRFPMTGVTGLSSSLDSHGYYTAAVSDLALAWSALSGEPEVARSVPPRLLVWSPPVDSDMAAALAAVRERLVTAGATVRDFPEHALIAEVTEAQTLVMAYEAARERAAELAVIEQISDQLADLLRTGAATPDSEYAAAQRTIAVAGERVAELLIDHDAILGPAAAGSAPAGLASTGDPIASRPWQAFGLPAVGVPGARSDAGLPLGMQLVGRARDETALLATGRWVEAVW
jgi:Asp-tRNA(Asn)/Glu-tRNA(Gln) amidotransferase A subunit family amidase